MRFRPTTLKGLYHLMVGDEEQATRHLYRSIDCFSLTNSMQAKYAIQIAASLAYLAEIEQVRGHFQVAVTHLEEVLRLVGDQSVDSVRVVFEIDLGIAYYWKGDLVQARLYFDDRIYCNSVIDYFRKWCRCKR